VTLARPVTPETTFNAYSITKILTSATVLRLARSGRIDLDAPIASAAAVEGLEAYGSVRETLLHRAGFRNPNPLKWFHTAQSHDTFDEAAFVSIQLQALRGSRRRLARSGYSNIGYLMLGLAIERVWPGPFVEAVRALVIDGLRLRPDERLAFAIDHPDGHAHGHLRRHGLIDLTMGLLVDRSSIVQNVGDRWVQLRLHHVNGSAYGGLIANARGLARFGHSVLVAHEAAESGAWRQLLEIVPGPGPCRSLGLFGGQLGRHRWLAHAGGGLGGYGELRLYPQLQIVSALLTNGPGVRDARCLDAVDRTWIDEW
jgi:CubicO group peptidase (beta-lactamase class C family)